MKIKISNFIDDDYVGVSKILKEVYSSEVSLEVLNRYYLDKGYIILVAKQELTGIIVGVSFVEEKIDYIRNSHYLYVTYVAVDAEVRKCGIGKMLFSKIEQIATEKRCSSIELTSANFRVDAHAFYSSIGFSKKKTTCFIKEV